MTSVIGIQSAGLLSPRIRQAAPTLWPRRWRIAGVFAALALLGAADGPHWMPYVRGPVSGALSLPNLYYGGVQWEGALWLLGVSVVLMALVLTMRLSVQQMQRTGATGSVRAGLLGHHAHGAMVVLDAALGAGLSVADGLEAAIRAASDRRVQALLTEVQARLRDDVPLGRALWESGLFSQSQRERLLALRRPDQVAAQLAELADSLRLPRMSLVTRPTWSGVKWMSATAVVACSAVRFILF